MTPAMAPSPLAAALLRPRSVALVGVSNDPTKAAGRPLQFLRRAGYAGRVYCVNPTRETVQGEPAYPSLDALPERPDHAFVLTATDSAIAAVAQCARLAVPVATVLAGGFAEAGAEGAERQARLIAAAGGTRILGPSSIGVVNLHERLVLTANAAFAEPDLPAGGVFVASQSGSMIGALLSRGKARGLGFAGLVSVGGEADIALGEVCAAALDDPRVESFMLFLESMRHADALADFARAASGRGKPVAAYKLGRSAAASELAVSHTGALAGSDEVADVFLRDCGIARVDTLDGLIEIMPLLRRVRLGGPAARAPRVGVVTTTGGGAAMAVDRLALGGAEVAGPSAATLARLAGAGVEVAPGRVVDLTLAGTRYDVMKAALGVLLEAPEFDLVLAAVGSSARFQPELAVKPIADSAAAATPLAAFLVPEAPDAARRLADAGVPVFRTPESCADAITAAFARTPTRAGPVPRIAGAAPTPGPLLDEAEAYRLLDRLSVPHAPFVVLDPAAPVPELPFAYPVAAKVLHRDIAHKTEAGGVILDIADRQALAAAMGRICDAVRERAGLDAGRILVQPMERGLGEVLVGFRRDPQMGPTVVLAAGGIATELYRDRSLRLAPVDLATAEAMIAEVKALRLLSGFRGRPPADLAAVARLVVALSHLATLADPLVVEAEVNPVVVKADGVVAVDALVRLAGP